MDGWEIKMWRETGSLHPSFEVGRWEGEGCWLWIMNRLYPDKCILVYFAEIVEGCCVSI